MLERASMPLTEDRHVSTSAEQSIWGKGSNMYGADLFGANDLPETYISHVRSTPLQLV